MDELLNRYRLALALVPDADAAGDLFMLSRTEAELRRRAARWRQQHGLPDVDRDLALPELTDVQREHARHLARRGLVRRRLRGWLTGIAALVLLVGGGYVAAEGMKPALDADPAFSAQPQQSVTGPDGLTLSVYKVALASETEGISTVTIWWELRGPGASDRSGRLRPEIRLASRSWRTRFGWTPAAATEFYSSRIDRVRAVSRFHTRVQGDIGLFRIERGDGHTVADFMLRFAAPANGKS